VKKRNKQFHKDKEYINFVKKLQENRNAQRNLGWIELPEPEFIGYEAKLEPRHDIQNRKDSDVFWEICEKFGSVERTRSYFTKSRKDKDKLFNIPNIRYIDEHTYLSLRTAVQKYFTKDIFLGSSFTGNKYYCNLPCFYWQIIYFKSYRTKVRLFDEILKQEESELKYILDFKFYNKRCQLNNAPKHFRKTLNRKLRKKSKSILFNIINNDKEIEFCDNYKNCNWYWW
jgi:hypothetical protein